MSCEVIGKTCKLPDEKIPLVIPITGAGFIRTRENSKIYGLGVFFRPAKPNGYEYEVTRAGQTGPSLPDYPTTPGEPVDDGSAQITCREISADSLVRVPASCAWSVTPSGPTISGEQLINTNGEGQVSCLFEGGTGGKTVYQLKASVTFNDGTIADGIIEVTVD